MYNYNNLNAETGVRMKLIMSEMTDYNKERIANKGNFAE